MESARARENPVETISLEERIRRRAYEIHLERGDQPGSELDDWFQAEKEILDAQNEAQASSG